MRLSAQEEPHPDVVDTSATNEGGAAIFEDGGALVVIHSRFRHNQCASTGQDVAGGAIVGLGSSTLVVEDSVFEDNSGSNGGAIGSQDENATVVNSTFKNNHATGHDGNPGNGGDGGAMSFDGAHVSWTMCGDTFEGNQANVSGGAIFRVSPRRFSDRPVRPEELSTSRERGSTTWELRCTASPRSV